METSSSSSPRNNNGKIISTTLYYDQLGVSPYDSARDIRKAYFKLALKYHPDKLAPLSRIHNSEDDNAFHNKWHEIQRAYVVLSNPNDRVAYDLYGPSLVSCNTNDDDVVGKLSPMLWMTLIGFTSSGFSNWYCCNSNGSYIFQAIAGTIVFIKWNSKRRKEEEKRQCYSEEVTSVSDFITIAGLALVVGNFSGYVASSMLRIVCSSCNNIFQSS